MKSPTQNSLKLLRKAGWHCEVTEHWNPFCKIRKDLFGFIDILALRGDETLAVQTTSLPNISARIKKITSLQSAALWLESPSRRIVVHGWKKKGGRWECKSVEVTH